MQTWTLKKLLAVALGLTLIISCEKPVTGLLNQELLKAHDSKFQTVTEDSSSPSRLQLAPPPQRGDTLPFGGKGVDGPVLPIPGPPPPFFDPVTGGPALPPPPPPIGLDDEGIEPRAVIIQTRCRDPLLTLKELDANTDAVMACKDGNTISGDGCSDICIKEFCGNGIVEPEFGEECDGGLGPRVAQAENCDMFCRLIICGDGIVEGAGTDAAKSPEQCDLGPRNGGCSGCSSLCQLQTCTIHAGCTCTVQ